MEVDIARNQLSLKDCLMDLKLKVENLQNLRKMQPTQEDLANFYKTDILPLLLQVRKINRMEKNELESLNKKIREMNQNLRTIAENCDCLEFEAAWIRNDVNKVTATDKPEELSNGIPTKPSINHFDVNSVALKDHETRMRLLDDEQDRRRQLQQRLVHLNEEINSIERSTNLNSKQLEQVKPFIRQLLDKIAQTTS